MTAALIGRDHPAGVLRAEADRAADSHGGLVLVTGEPGIGKTSLVTAAVADARRRGTLVLGGSCWASESAPGYWPWVQVVRALRRGVPTAEWAGAREAAGSGLDVLLGGDPAATGAEGRGGRRAHGPPHEHGPPDGVRDRDGVRDGDVRGEVRGDDHGPDHGHDHGHDAGPHREGAHDHVTDPAAVAGPPAGPGRDAAGPGPYADTFHLADAVTTALVAVSQFRPVIVVLDDLHWADPASLRLLEFAAQHTWFERLLLIGTYRDAEVDTPGHPLREQIAPLVAKATTLTLTGLDRAGTARLMARTAGRDPDEALAAEVHRRTGGNPFFIEQTARLWAGGGSADAVAPGVRDALQRRLRLLPAPVAELLVAAAVLGREFHRQVLAAAVGKPPGHVDRLLETAVAARLVVGRGAGTFAFGHDLVRETLYEELDPAEARRRHATVVRALDAAPALSEKVFPADLARHAWAAGDELPAEQAVGLLRAAGQDAGTRLAFEEVLTHLRRAYERSAGTSARCRLLTALDLGGALLHAGKTADAWPLFDGAVRVARADGDPEMLARVALGVYSAEGYCATVPQDQLDANRLLLHEAHRALARSSQPEPAGGTAGSAGELSADQMAAELSITLSVSARRGQDDEQLGFGLWTRHNAIWGLGTAAERLALTEELITLAERAGNPSGRHIAVAMRWVALLELGDPRFSGTYRDYVTAAEQSDLASIRHSLVMDQSLVAALRGDFDAAERYLAEVVELGRDKEHEQWIELLDHHWWTIRMLQGRYAEAAEAAARLSTAGHGFPAGLRALAELRRGDTEPALRLIAEGPPTHEQQNRGFFPLWLRLEAETAAATRDPELSAAVRDALTPHRGQWLVAVYGWDMSGPVDYWLALVDAAEGRWTRAAEGFREARRSADLLQARPWSVLARHGLARVLREQGDPAAEKLARETAEEAARLGMRLDTEENPRPAPTPPAPPPTGAEFRYDGRVWTLTYAGRTVHLPDAKGLRDLHTLLGAPGTDVPAVRLLNPEGGEEVVAAHRMGGDPLLDAEAKSRYRSRLELLDEEIDHATATGDDTRAAAYDRERAALLEELRAAAGLAGRTRRLGDEAERARKAVGARIRDALRKIANGHPDLAAHLRQSLSTGTTCTYHPPDPPPAWRL
ncbi:AAA family ATPase [Streptomyces sp. WMMC500]|uniref:AAA family ATPase n=1 Tax=Streptomyces sp. WMMC500 TaxID=3015154 RepID=UPI00248C55EB|nr:AAA family ATPase [Streptomyces sp. WMMC500]WBB57796.1 AAA family ATPase [Streptomyces sp. WMMC500]